MQTHTHTYKHSYWKQLILRNSCLAQNYFQKIFSYLHQRQSRECCVSTVHSVNLLSIINKPLYSRLMLGQVLIRDNLALHLCKRVRCVCLHFISIISGDDGAPYAQSCNRVIHFTVKHNFSTSAYFLFSFPSSSSSFLAISVLRRWMRTVIHRAEHR